MRGIDHGALIDLVSWKTSLVTATDRVWSSNHKPWQMLSTMLVTASSRAAVPAKSSLPHSESSGGPSRLTDHKASRPGLGRCNFGGKIASNAWLSQMALANKKEQLATRCSTFALRQESRGWLSMDCLSFRPLNIRRMSNKALCSPVKEARSELYDFLQAPQSPSCSSAFLNL